MATDSAKLDTLARGLIQGQVRFTPSRVDHTSKCTACHTYIQTWKGLFIQAPAAFVVEHKLGAHLCLACAELVHAQASALHEKL